ncbi:hypothetical protein HK405_014225, partial [Cladochytrium tenue]
LPAAAAAAPDSAATVAVVVPAKGYAYSGGGRRVTRVEVSVDDGRSWTLAPRVVHSGGSSGGAGLAPRHGSRFWCWFMWEAEVTIHVPVSAATEAASSTGGGGVRQVAEVLVRSWDAAQNTQPREMTWNLLGMMSNSWYRVKLVRDDRSGTMYWEHPTNIGESKEAGWMAREKRAAETAAVDPSAAAPSGNEVTGQQQAPASGSEGSKSASQQARPRPDLPSMTMAQVAEHRSEADCWVVIDGVVLDVTPFLKRHPGGVKALVMVAGTDATDDFYAIHGAAAAKMKDRFAVGYVAVEAKAEADGGAPGAGSSEGAGAGESKEGRRAKL